MKRNFSESVEHTNLTRMMVNHFSAQNYVDIKADIEGFEKPAVIYGTDNNHIPDATCNKRTGVFKTPVILEVEVGSSIYSEHTASQWTLFHKAAIASGGEFHIAVPKTYEGQSCIAMVKQRLRDLNIDSNKVTIWTPV